jgi:hypothetical protein
MKLPMVTIVCSPRNTSINAALMFFEKAMKRLKTIVAINESLRNLMTFYTGPANTEVQCLSSMKVRSRISARQDSLKT